jgi:hypothetical protein
MRGHEGGVRQPVAPLPSQFDQIVPVGSQAMKENDEMSGRPGLRARRGPSMAAMTVILCGLSADRA